MMTFSTIIPKQRNDGSAVPRKELTTILRDLWVRFGGLRTKVRWTATGSMRKGSTITTEASR